MVCLVGSSSGNITGSLKGNGQVALGLPPLSVPPRYPSVPPRYPLIGTLPVDG